MNEPNKDIELSVSRYNEWYKSFAPKAYERAYQKAKQEVERLFKVTNNLTRFEVETFVEDPSLLEILRHVASPPLAHDRLAGLVKLPPQIASALKKAKTDQNVQAPLIQKAVENIIDLVLALSDKNIIPWLKKRPPTKPSTQERSRALHIIADRVTLGYVLSQLRSEQEAMMLRKLKGWLENRGYYYLDKKHLNCSDKSPVNCLPPKTFTFQLQVKVRSSSENTVRIPIDVAVKPVSSPRVVLVEAKAAGDFTNPNKRRKEDEARYKHLLTGLGKNNFVYIMYLFGYFNQKYLDHLKAAEIPWVWEHNLDALSSFDL